MYRFLNYKNRTREKGQKARWGRSRNGAETSDCKVNVSRRWTLPPHGQSVQGHSDGHPKAEAEGTAGLRSYRQCHNCCSELTVKGRASWAAHGPSCSSFPPQAPGSAPQVHLHTTVRGLNRADALCQEEQSSDSQGQLLTSFKLLVITADYVSFKQR